MATASTFSAMRKGRKDGLSKLTQAVEKLNERGGGGRDDATFWQPTRDKAGNAFAEIRFLPAPPGEDLPWARIFTHAFKGPTGQWYIENSRTTLGEPDPVSEHNQQLWATELPENQALVRQRKRKLNYVANIYVIKDPANPENEGRVFKYKFGKKIWDKIQSAIHPEPNTDDPINVFDFWDGANFKLKVRTVDKYPNYDMSQFTSPGPLSEDDEELEKIWKAQYSLAEIVKPENFKPYEELKKHFYRVIGEGGVDAGAPKSGRTALAERAPARSEESEDDDTPPAPAPKRTLPPRGKPATAAAPDDEDADLAEFQALLGAAD